MAPMTTATAASSSGWAVRRRRGGGGGGAVALSALLLAVLCASRAVAAAAAATNRDRGADADADADDVWSKRRRLQKQQPPRMMAVGGAPRLGDDPGTPVWPSAFEAVVSIKTNWSHPHSARVYTGGVYFSAPLQSMRMDMLLAHWGGADDNGDGDGDGDNGSSSSSSSRNDSAAAVATSPLRGISRFTQVWRYDLEGTQRARYDMQISILTSRIMSCVYTPLQGTLTVPDFSNYTYMGTNGFGVAHYATNTSGRNGVAPDTASVSGGGTVRQGPLGRLPDRARARHTMAQTARATSRKGSSDASVLLDASVGAHAQRRPGEAAVMDAVGAIWPHPDHDRYDYFDASDDWAERASRMVSGRAAKPDADDDDDDDDRGDADDDDDDRVPVAWRTETEILVFGEFSGDKQRESRFKVPTDCKPAPSRAALPTGAGISGAGLHDSQQAAGSLEALLARGERSRRR